MVPFILRGIFDLMKKALRIVTLISLLPWLALSPLAGQVQWLSWQEAQVRNAKEPRKFIVDVITQWCGWCKKMDKATFDQANISEYVNQHFYAVKFDAETKTDIDFNNQTYKFVRSGSTGYHELAGELTFGKLSFPTLVFLDEKLNVIQPIPGYKDPVSLDKIMRYFAEDHYKSMPWKKFEELYASRAVPVTGQPASSTVPRKD